MHIGRFLLILIPFEELAAVAVNESYMNPTRIRLSGKQIGPVMHYKTVGSFSRDGTGKKDLHLRLCSLKEL